MKRIKQLLFLVAALATFVGGFAPQSLHAQVAPRNAVVKGSGPALYWVSWDGRRSLFPNADTYFTWFPSFANIQKVNDADLALLPNGGTVTYRPGARLVKFPDNAQVYAVSRGGVLRHVVSGQIAQDLYGYQWWAQVRDIPVSLRDTYRMGGSITSASQYNVSAEYNSISNPSDNLVAGPVNPYIPPNYPTYPTYQPYPTYPVYQNPTYPTYPVTNGYMTQLVADRSVLSYDENVTLVARVNNSSRGEWIRGDRRFDVRIRDQFGGVVQTCSNIAENETCTYSMFVSMASGDSRTFTADAVERQGNAYTASQGQVTITKLRDFNESRVKGISIVSNDTRVTRGATTRLTVNAFNAGNINYNGKRIDIVDNRNGNVVRTCYGQSWCAADVTIQRISDEIGVQFYAVLRDENGNEVARGYSQSILFTNL